MSVYLQPQSCTLIFIEHQKEILQITDFLPPFPFCGIMKMLTNSIIKTKEKQHAEMGRPTRGNAIKRG